MKKAAFIFIGIISLMIISCGDSKPESVMTPRAFKEEADDTTHTIDTDGYWDNGEIIKNFDCPDSKFFPPIDIKVWDKTPVVNGRLPTYKETLNGKSIHTYGGKNNPRVKVYPLTLPKLAYFVNGPAKLVVDDKGKKITSQPEVVVVVQIVQTASDTMIGFRYLSGGVGGSLFRDFRFLTDEEVKKEMEK
jgi:hypothetical protein